VLTLNDKVMIEPLSLNDFADLPAVDPVIVCKVPNAVHVAFFVAWMIDPSQEVWSLPHPCFLEPTGNNPGFLNVAQFTYIHAPSPIGATAWCCSLRWRFT
jgi:hypothetical protein